MLFVLGLRLGFACLSGTGGGLLRLGLRFGAGFPFWNCCCWWWWWWWGLSLGAVAFAPAKFESPRFLLADPEVNYFFFWLDTFPWLSKAGNVFFAFCIFSAAWCTKAGWCCFLFIGSLNHFFWFWYIWHAWLLIWLADWFIKSKIYFFIPGVLVSTQEIPKFSKTTCWHVMDAQNTIP